MRRAIGSQISQLVIEQIVIAPIRKTTARTASPAASASAYVRSRPVCSAAHALAELLRRLAEVRSEISDQRSSSSVRDECRERSGGPVEERVVELVEVELAARAGAAERRRAERRVCGRRRAATRRRFLRGRAAGRERRSDGLHPVVGSALASVRRDRREPVRERRPERRELEPAADEREHGEQRDRREHRPAAPSLP